MATATYDPRFERRSGQPDRRRGPSAAAMDFLSREEVIRTAAPTVVAASATEGVKVSWGGIWGGVLAAVGTLLLLAALGVAVGITATDPAQADAGTLGTAAGIWTAASLLVALFVGGMVAARIGATFDRSTAFWEGALVWVVSLLLMAYLATSGVSQLASGAISFMGGAPQAAAQARAQGQGMVDQMKSRLEGAAGDLTRKASAVKPEASRAAWITFGALVLSLAAALFGAMAGCRRVARRLGRD